MSAGTVKKAEGTAVGENKRKKGHRSHHPLYCTAARAGALFDALHRASSVHHSNGVRSCVSVCIEGIRPVLANRNHPGKHGPGVAHLTDVGA